MNIAALFSGEITDVLRVMFKDNDTELENNPDA
jgi:hypothetical protein